MEVNDQLHATTALPPRKDPMAPLHKFLSPFCLTKWNILLVMFTPKSHTDRKTGR